ncbi:helix-turn-helix domain-containing protein [Vallitalea okinawensis]|uniref:helix-turn-helix domain-containing protein n=1 Tax=Vallitalea okinawensis TaxID=2078660 RepID=UPI0014786262|nr:AraC family transcriptional regulator [Vallitalea okinawensis]
MIEKDRGSTHSNRVYEFSKRFSEVYTIPKFVAVGINKAEEKWSFWEHLHHSNEYVYIRKGAVKYWCDDQEHIAHAGDFYIIHPGQKHREVSYIEPLEFIYLKFRYKQMDQLSHPQEQIIRNADKDIVTLMEQIIIELEEQELGTKQIVEAIILQLIWRVKRRLNLNNDCDQVKIDSKNIIVQEAIEYIKSHQHEKITVKQIAENCNVSTDYLAHIFKEITEFSLLQYVDHIKMDEASIMLLNTDMNIRQIAYELGYNDALYFSKKFKKFFKLSPTDYRKQNMP